MGGHPPRVNLAPWMVVAFGRVEMAGLNALIPARCTGFVNDDRNLALLYCAADVVLVPSRQDNFPQCATEAQACGTPVALTTIGSTERVE